MLRVNDGLNHLRYKFICFHSNTHTLQDPNFIQLWWYLKSSLLKICLDFAMSQDSFSSARNNHVNYKVKIESLEALLAVLGYSKNKIIFVKFKMFLHC